VQESIEPIVGQWIWMIAEWHRRLNKNPTTPIKIIYQHKVPAEWMKDVT
jgi:hypothetical protein